MDFLWSNPEKPGCWRQTPAPCLPPTAPHSRLLTPNKPRPPPSGMRTAHRKPWVLKARGGRQIFIRLILPAYLPEPPPVSSDLTRSHQVTLPPPSHHRSIRPDRPLSMRRASRDYPHVQHVGRHVWLYHTGHEFFLSLFFPFNFFLS